MRELTHLFEDVASMQPVTRGVSFMPDAYEDGHDALGGHQVLDIALSSHRLRHSANQPHA